jgi:hypothetical protein
MIIQYSRENIKNSASYYSDSFLQNQKSKMNNNNKNNNNDTFTYSDNVDINSLEIADGLKELLIDHGFTLEELSHIPSSQLAELLGIDKYNAQIIESALAKLSNDRYASFHRLNDNFTNRYSIT